LSLRLECCIAALLALACAPAQAFDVGDPSFRLEEESPVLEVEGVYERFSRSVRLKRDHYLVGSPAGPVGVSNAVGRSRETQEVSPGFVRFIYHPCALVATQFDLGLDGESSGGDQVVLLGGAARVLLYDHGPIRLATQFSAHFIPEFETLDRGVHPTLGAYEARGDMELQEYGLTVVGALRVPVSQSVHAVLYGGPRVSAHRGEFNAVADYTNQFLVGGVPVGSRAWFSGVTKQASPFGAVIGLRTDWGRHWRTRVEGRLIEEQSVSIALAASY